MMVVMGGGDSGSRGSSGSGSGHSYNGRHSHLDF